MRHLGHLGNWGHGFDYGGSRSNGLHNCGGSGSNDIYMLNIQRFTVYDSIESVDGIGGVMDSAFIAIGIDQTVMTMDHITITLFGLALGITGHGILDTVGKFILRMRIIILNGLGDNCWLSSHYRSTMIDVSMGRDNSTIDGNKGQQSKGGDKL